MPKEINSTVRLSKAAKEFNVSLMTIRKFLSMKGFQVDSSPNTKLTAEMYALLTKEFQGEKDMKNEAKRLGNISYRGGGASIESNSYTSAVANPEVIKEIEKRKKQKEKERKLKKEERLNKQKEERKEKKEERKRKIKTKIEYRIPFSELEFGQGIVSITYKEKRYVYRNNKIKDYDSILEQIYSRLSYTQQNSIKSYLVKVVIFMETDSFNFKEIDICKTVNDLKKRFLGGKKESLTNNTLLKNKNVIQKSSSALKTMILEGGNIQFYNGYYMVFQITNGKVDDSVAPFRVNDPDSYEILNLVHKYFEQKLEEKHIIVKLDDTKIVEPSGLELFKLKDYVRYLKQNLDEKGEWWKEVLNYRKPSLKQCRSVSAEVSKKMVSLKNGYLDSLVSMQSEIKLIPVYEINNHGKKEDAFIFSINMPNNRCAVVFENASDDAATATWVFVTKIENYESCINLVFDYFTNYSLSTKRFSLRAKTVNPPEKFKAEGFTFIDHDDLRQWLKKLNKVLEQTPEPSEIQFVPGLHIPKSSETRKGHNETIATKHLHNQLIRKLYDKLCSKYGQDKVGTENRVGTKRVDVVVKGNGYYDFYEIKTAANAYDCVKEALGQLFLYAFLSCSRVRKMVVVGTAEASKEFEQYLSMQRKSNSLQLYYMKV